MKIENYYSAGLRKSLPLIAYRLSLIVLLLLSLIAYCSSAFAEGSTSVYMQDLTWIEIKNRLQSGTTTVIVPTGGTEEEGPHMVTGKHNSVARYAAGEIAKRLGGALVAPVIPYAPSGRISPPEGHMQFEGTISITPRTYSMMLADTARSLKEHGFHTICFIGDSLASQAMQAQVAQVLSDEWASENVRVVNVSSYFYKNGQDEWNDNSGLKIRTPAAHAGHIDTSEMMAVDESGVRATLLGTRTEKDYKTTGAMGDSSLASADYGRRYLSLKIEAAVKQIQNASNHAQ